jgi:hypothetical protein
MSKAAIAHTFSYRVQEDGTVQVRGPEGTIVATCPDPIAGGIILGWMRLASYAHKQLKDNPELLHQILTEQTVTETEAELKQLGVFPQEHPTRLKVIEGIR